MTYRRIQAFLSGGAVVALGALLADIAPPRALVATLASASSPSADPASTVLAALAGVAELLTAYLLVVIALGLLAVLPGAAGRLAGALTQLVAVPALRRWIGAAAGGVLLVNLTVAASPAGAAPRGTAQPTSSRATRPVATSTPPTTPTPSSVAIAQLEGLIPPGGPHRARTYIVRPGDSLWSIAAGELPPDERTGRRIDVLWRQVYAMNRRSVGPDADLIMPGTRLAMPRSGRFAEPTGHGSTPPVPSGSGWPDG